MGIVAYLIYLAILGLIVGGLARLALPGPDPLTIWQTILIGVVASYVAGVVTLAIFGRAYYSLIVAEFFAVLIVYAIRRSRGGSLTRPGRPPDRHGR
jgi:uncharacterized membrane protein YeaQ/YmgE (transglycosylase-associated protein family)